MRTTALRSIAGLGAGVLLLAGCSSSDEGDASPSTTTAAQTTQGTSPTSEASPTSESGSGGGGGGAFDKTAAQAVLLTAEEAGAGYTEVPPAQIAAALEQAGGTLTQALSQMKVEPAQCQAVMHKMIGQLGELADQIEQVAMTLLVDASSQDSVTQSIGPASVLGTGDTIKAQVGACQEMTLTIQGITAKATMNPVAIDLGDDSVGVLTTIEINAGGQQVSQSSGSAYVVSGDTVMSLALQGTQATESRLTELAATAYEKAKPVME